MFDISRNKDRKWHTICKTRKDAANYVGACRGSVWKWNCQGSLGSTHGDSGGIDFFFFLTLSLTFTCIISRKRYSERAQTNVQKFLHTIYMYIAYTCIYICIQMHTFSFQIGKNMLYINYILYRQG